VLVGGVVVVGERRCSWWGIVHGGLWLLVWQAVVGVPLRVAVRVTVGAVSDDGRRDAWWCPDVLARPRISSGRVRLRGRCDGCASIPMLG